MSDQISLGELAERLFCQSTGIQLPTQEPFVSRRPLEAWNTVAAGVASAFAVQVEAEHFLIHEATPNAMPVACDDNCYREAIYRVCSRVAEGGSFNNIMQASDWATGQWKYYPSDLPEEGQTILAQRQGEFHVMKHISGNSTAFMWMPLPKTPDCFP